MDTLSYKTLSSNKITADKKWFIVDANGQNLGRFASKIAKVLRGKYKTNFTPHADCGDNVVIVNASKITMSGNKMDNREIFSHTGFPGGQKRISPRKMLEKDGTSVVRHAIKGMLPKNKWQSVLMNRLKIYKNSDHPHGAQNPKAIEV